MSNALIFGTFNPVTNAHVNMGIVANNTLKPECNVIYIPTNDAYIRNWKGYKDGNVLSGTQRVTLLSDAVSKYGFTVSEVEILGLTDGKTYNTISYFSFDDAVLCLGIDNIPQMKKWYRWQELLHKVKLLIFYRKGYDKTDEFMDEIMDILSYSSGYEWANLEQNNISSTEVRKLYKERNIDRRSMDRLKEIVPDNVFKYLEENEDVYF